MMDRTIAVAAATADLVRGAGARRRQKTMMTLARFSLLVFIACLGTGCVNSGMGERRTLVFDRLPEANAVTLNVSNFRGNVRVTVDPTTELVVVQARTRSGADLRVRGNAPGSRESAREAVDNIEVIGEIVRRDAQGLPGPRLGERAASASIILRTATDYERSDLQSVDFDIIAPPVEMIEIETADGHVIVEGFAGGVTATTNNGSLIAQTEAPVAGPVILTNTNGDVHFNTRPNWRGEIDAIAVDGEIDVRAGEGQVRMRHEGDSRVSVSVLEGAGAFVTDRGAIVNSPRPVTLQATNGDVMVRLDEDAIRNAVTLRWWP